MKERTRIKTDVEALLPGEEFQIGSQSVTIRPLSLQQYSFILGKLRALASYCKEQGITEENFQETLVFIQLAEIILSKFPDILEEVSNIHIDDLQELPIEIIVSLIDKCLDVNLKAKESLMGNFKSLTGKMASLSLQSGAKLA